MPKKIKKNKNKQDKTKKSFTFFQYIHDYKCVKMFWTKLRKSCIKHKMNVSLLRLLLYCRYFGPLLVGKSLSKQSEGPM